MPAAGLRKLMGRVKRGSAPITLRLLRLAVRFPYLSNAWYLFDRGFEREHLAVLRGRLRYLQGQSGGEAGGVFMLRRNTHRLEKGLIMRPRRPIFAKDYLPETVDAYVGLKKTKGDDANAQLLLWWSGDVLDRYFDAVAPGQDARVDEARGRFEQSRTKPDGRREGDANRSPFVRDTSPLGVTIDDMMRLARRRRSARWFLDKPVPREMIDRAVEVAAQSPSACNRQPFEFRFFDDPELVQKVADIPMGTRGFSQQFPMVMAIVGKLYAFPLERDRHVPYIDGSLAAMAFEFALEVQGLATCSVNWPDIAIRESMMARALGLAPDERVIMCMAIGFPDPEAEVPYSQKKSLDELRSFNKTTSSVTDPVYDPGCDPMAPPSENASNDAASDQTVERPERVEAGA